MNREQYISHLRTVACGLHLDGIQKWADLIVDNIHWVKEKTLTDEEITDVFVECLLPDGEFDEHEFARAILRKAQENG
jgi:Ca2+-binding EF-hand superfamily protein